VSRKLVVLFCILLKNGVWWSYFNRNCSGINPQWNPPLLL